jgi:Transposase IS4
MSRWYGKGGDWINAGLPHYIAIDRKPENGCEIQTACCGTSGIMMSLRLVKGDKGDELLGDPELNHGVGVMLTLLDKWPSRGRIVCADSYFASVQAAVAMYKLGWRFIGVVKTATKLFPQKYLQQIVLPERGMCAGLTTRHEEEELDVDLLAFVYCDRDRHYFISSCSNLTAGSPISRQCVQQIEEVETNADPERVHITLDVPKAAEIYYSTCGKIDQHNRCRQDTLNLEKKLETKEWHRRVNMSIFGMVVVDSWMLYKGCTGGEKMGQMEYYKALINNLIDNPYFSSPAPRIRAPMSASSVSSSLTVGTFGSSIHLTPTKRKSGSAESKGNKRMQHRCRLCPHKTVMVCSICRQLPELGDSHVAYCAPTTERACFHQHVCNIHH